MDWNSIKYEINERVGTITINKPAVLNAFDEEVVAEMNAVLDSIEREKNIGCLIITGAGKKAFSAGGDIAKELKQDARGAYEYSRLGTQITSRLEKLRIPVIAAINGYALGGGLEFTLACDIRVAADTAKMGTPEVNLAVCPGWGGTQRLPRLIGEARTKEMLFLGKPITAQKAYEFGLVNKVVPAEELMDVCFEMASEIASKAPLALEKAKAAIYLGMQCDVERGLEIESALFGPLYGTEDQQEAMTAFLEKREPRPFKGR